MFTTTAKKFSTFNNEASATEATKDLSATTKTTSDVEVSKKENTIFDALDRFGEVVSGIVNKVARGVRIMLIFAIVLLVVRHFIPSIEDVLPAPFYLLDEFVVPILNWLYAMFAKILEYITSLPVIERVLASLRNLVA